MTPVTDTDLHAWLDGELPPERRAEVEAWLRDHPEAAAEARLWAADREALRARFDPVLEEPVPERLLHLVRQRRAPPPPPAWTRWAAAVGLFAVGALVGAALAGRVLTHEPIGPTSLSSPANPWVQRAAVAHSVYVPEVRHAVEVKAQEEHLARWLTRRLTVPVKLFDLRSQGFELVGGRLLPDTPHPTAQLMYQRIGPVAEGAKPDRVTVYLRKPDDDTPVAFRYERQGDLGMFYWVEGAQDGHPACGYALVGTLPREELLALVQSIEQQR